MVIKSGELINKSLSLLFYVYQFLIDISRRFSVCFFNMVSCYLEKKSLLCAILEVCDILNT